MVKSITIEPWHKCPQNCRFCSSEEVENIDDERLDLEDIKVLISRHNPDVVRWSGGEPLAGTVMMFFVNTVNKMGKVRGNKIEQIINTCGQFNYVYWRKTLEKVDCVRFSLLGDKLGHNHMTDGKNYGKIMDNIVKCVANDEIKVELTTPYLGYEYLLHVIQTAEVLDLNIRVASLVHPEKYVDYGIPNDLIGDFKETVRTLSEYRKDRLKVACSLDTDKPCKRDEKVLIYPDGSEHKCAVEKIGFCLRKLQDGDGKW